jgi:TM2 domain-containing membrane protein YozV
MNCPKCGRENYDKTKECVWCGANLKNPFQTRQKPIKPEILDENNYPSTANETKTNSNQGNNPLAKQRVVAGLLAIFLGALGVHNFYLGYNNRAFTQIFLTTFGSFFLIGPILSSIWAFIEGVAILAGQVNEDASGQPLV